MCVHQNRIPKSIPSDASVVTESSRFEKEEKTDGETFCTVLFFLQTLSRLYGTVVVLSLIESKDSSHEKLISQV